MSITTKICHFFGPLIAEVEQVLWVQEVSFEDLRERWRGGSDSNITPIWFDKVQENRKLRTQHKWMLSEPQKVWQKKEKWKTGRGERPRLLTRPQCTYTDRVDHTQSLLAECRLLKVNWFSFTDKRRELARHKRLDSFLHDWVTRLTFCLLFYFLSKMLRRKEKGKKAKWSGNIRNFASRLTFPNEISVVGLVTGNPKRESNIHVCTVILPSWLIENERCSVPKIKKMTRHFKQKIYDHQIDAYYSIPRHQFFTIPCNWPNRSTNGQIRTVDTMWNRNWETNRRRR